MWPGFISERDALRVTCLGNGVDETHKIANFRGFSDKTGKSAKQMMKQARAARLQPPKTRRRSHLLTVDSTRQQVFPYKIDSKGLLVDNNMLVMRQCLNPCACFHTLDRSLQLMELMC
jgi:hypothetical protein